MVQKNTLKQQYSNHGDEDSLLVAHYDGTKMLGMRECSCKHSLAPIEMPFLVSAGISHILPSDRFPFQHCHISDWVFYVFWGTKWGNIHSIGIHHQGDYPYGNHQELEGTSPVPLLMDKPLSGLVVDSLFVTVGFSCLLRYRFISNLPALHRYLYFISIVVGFRLLFANH